MSDDDAEQVRRERDAAEGVLHRLGWVKSTDHVTGSVQWFPAEPPC